MQGRRRIWVVLGVLFVLLVYLEFAPKSVSYQGENSEWQVKLDANLLGNKASNTLTIAYLGEGRVTDAKYHIWPLARSGTLLLNAEDNLLPPRDRLKRAEQVKEFAQSGIFVETCTNEHCEYIDNEKELLFTILWQEEDAEEYRLERIVLERNKRWFHF